MDSNELKSTKPHQFVVAYMFYYEIALSQLYTHHMMYIIYSQDVVAEMIHFAQAAGCGCDTSAHSFHGAFAPDPLAGQINSVSATVEKRWHNITQSGRKQIMNALGECPTTVHSNTNGGCVNNGFYVRF